MSFFQKASELFCLDYTAYINKYLGGNGDWEDYEYLAWEGLEDFPPYANDPWFIEHLQTSKERYENNNLPVVDPCD